MATIEPSLVLPFIALLLAGFLLGSIPFPVWVARAAGVQDVRRHGSRNPGAANVWRTAGRVFGVLAGALDAGKGAAAVWLSWHAGLPDALAVWPGAAAVLGHDFSPWLGWRGGKGGATMVGMLACFLFPELLVVLALWIVWSVASPRTRFVGSIVCVSLTPLLAALSGRTSLPIFASLPPRPWSIVLASALLAVLLWIRVSPGLARAEAPREA